MQATHPICAGVWAVGTAGQDVRGHLGAGLGAVGLCVGCQLHPAAACAAAGLPSPSPLSASRGCCSRLSPPPFPWERVRRPPLPPLRPRPRRRPCTPPNSLSAAPGSPFPSPHPAEGSGPPMWLHPGPWGSVRPSWPAAAPLHHLSGVCGRSASPPRLPPSPFSQWGGHVPSLHPLGLA